MSKDPSAQKITLILGLLIASVVACSSTQIIRSNSTPALQSETYIPEDQLLDIGIAVFSPGIPEEIADQEKSGIVPDVRLAESRYMPFLLKDTLEQTGNWGAVRVTPADSTAVDLIIRGSILDSTGEQVKINIIAIDSSGETWLKKQYVDTASKFSYRRPKEDPFQDLYNDIANDLLALRDRLTRQEILNLRRISSLKFARSLSPDAFAEYVREDRSGKVTVTQLPAEDDPMVSRVNKIKEREYLFIDTLDDYYAKFYKEMELPYHAWRRYTYDVAIELKESKREARNRLLGGAAVVAGSIIAGSKSETYAGQTAAIGGVMGGIGLVKAGLDKYKQMEIQREELLELSQSLGAEISPIIYEIEGRTVELQGTVDDQYRQWRQILKDIYAEETGIPAESQN